MTTYRTGDCLVCYGRGFVSGLISWFTPRWKFWRKAPSHTAIIAVHPPPHEEGGAERAYVYESTTLGKLSRKCLPGSVGRGVRATPLVYWINTYDGEVWLHPLKVAMTTKREAAVLNYLSDVLGRRYDMDQAINSASPVINTEDGEELFCSELVAFALQHGGALSTSVNCSEVHPQDVTRFKCLGKRRQLK